MGKCGVRDREQRKRLRVETDVPLRAPLAVSLGRYYLCMRENHITYHAEAVPNHEI